MTILTRLRRFAGRHLPVASRAEVRAIRRGRADARRRADALASENRRLRESLEAQTVRAGLAERRAEVSDRWAGFAARLARGETLEGAAVGTVRDLIDAGEVDEAESMAHALADSAAPAPAGHLAVAVVAMRRDLPELAFAALRHVPPEAWRRHALPEYLAAVYACAPEQLPTALRDLLDAHDAHDAHDAYATARTWHEVLRYAYVIRESGLAERAFALLVDAGEKSRRVERGLHDRRGGAGGDVASEEEIEWLRPWVERVAPAADPPVQDGHTPVALLGYDQPGRAKASQNMGDYVQTLAALGQLVRRQDLRFHGDPELTGLARYLQGRVRPDRRLAGPGADVDLLVASRDASTYETPPEGTWVLLSGWFLHPVFGLRYEFPMHPNLRPIIVSFHCSKRQLLTTEAIEYLRRYGPVGCRDWTTVDLLLSAGVPAFFSGCLSTTVDTLFPEAEEVAEPGERSAAGPATVYVDMPREEVPSGAPTVRHSYRGVKRRGFAENMREAVALLDRYRREFTAVVTSRLHCYLPARALGLRVDFRPKNRADLRFNGLVDLDDGEFDALRRRLLDRLETVFGAVLDGRPADEVYALWREACAPDVAAARARRTANAPLGPPSLDVAGATARARSTRSGDPLRPPGADVVVAAAPYLSGPLRTTLCGLSAAAGDVRVWLLGRDWSPAGIEELVGAVGGADVRHVRCDELPAGTELLLLPELLPEARRVTLVPPTAAVLGDFRDLTAIDLGGRPVAARTVPGTAAARSGFGLLHRAASRLDGDPAAAADLHRRLAARHWFDFDAFDIHVAVVDLDRLRADRFTTEFLPYHERSGLDAREVLNLYAGPDRVHVPPEWAHVPARERVDHPKLVHWGAGPQPWADRYVAGRAYWRRAEAAAPSETHDDGDSSANTMSIDVREVWD